MTKYHFLWYFLLLMNEMTDDHTNHGFGRREFLVGGLLFGALTIGGVACAKNTNPNHPPVASTEVQTTYPAPPEAAETMTFLEQTGRSLLAAHEDAAGGWRFQSAIQAPHYQTDRDVGASSVGMGFLVLADQYPENPEWLSAAESTASWLLTVARRDDAGNLYWPDYVDDGEVSESNYTSFDDGTIGVGDFFWQLYEKTQNPQYKDAAISSLNWTLAQAENVGGDQPVYRWRWDANDDQSEANMGMGMGAVGLVHTLTLFHERLGGSDPALATKCKDYINGTLRYIDQVRTNLGSNDGDARALPETGIIGEDGDTAMNSGYLSGAAGAAFMYLKLSSVFDEPAYLQKAEELLAWLSDEQNGPLVTSENGLAWQLALDPQGGDDAQLATGFEEGAAGIGWVYLQAYKVTGKQEYLETAEGAARWLDSVAIKDSTGYSWHEDESPTNEIIHVNLNNGAAGIGMFMLDLAETSGKQEYYQIAQQAHNWVQATAQIDGNVLYWNDNDGEAPYSNDPSWHWGRAGLIGFMARMNGGSVNIPGQQPCL